jgi:hypothetical protein
MMVAWFTSSSDVRKIGVVVNAVDNDRFMLQWRLLVSPSPDGT